MGLFNDERAKKTIYLFRFLETVLNEGMGETLVETDPLGGVQHVNLLQKVSQLGNLNKEIVS
jgi:hypothetical protein